NFMGTSFTDKGSTKNWENGLGEGNGSKTNFTVSLILSSNNPSQGGKLTPPSGGRLVGDFE
ncbi:MAG: hypothetical protein AAFX53_17720, partial [Bacteroidota bacterium]